MVEFLKSFQKFKIFRYHLSYHNYNFTNLFCRENYPREFLLEIAIGSTLNIKFKQQMVGIEYKC